MRTLRSILLGLIAAVISATFTVIICVMLADRRSEQQIQASTSIGTGFGVAVDVQEISIWPAVPASIAGFVVGFWWDHRRARREFTR